MIDGVHLSEFESSAARSNGKKQENTHGHTTSLGPVVLLGLGLVEGATGLEHGLVDTSSSSDDTDGGTGESVDALLGTTRETDAGLALVNVVSDDGSVVAGSASERSAVSRLLLDVADDRSLGKLGEGEDVADGEGGLLAAEDKGAGREALGSDEGLGAHLVAVRVAEDDAGEGGSTA